MFSAFEVMALGDVTAWLGRIALYAGTFYIIAALIESRKGSIEVSNGWAEAFRSDRHQVETIFTRMLNGFSYHKIIVDGNGKPIDYVFLAANEAFEKMTGFKPENIIGKRVTEVLPGIEKDPADWIGAYGKVALTGQLVVIDNYAQPLGKWYSVSAFSPRRGYFAAIFEDITERKKTENKLEEYTKNLEGLVEERTRKLSSSALYTRSLIEASPDPLVTISSQGKITDVNRATELVTGFPRDQLINSDFSDYFTEPDKARVGYRRVFTDGFVKDYPLAIRHKSGKITDVLYNATVYRDEAGNVQGVFAAARDVTERRKAEDTLRKQAALIDLSPDGTIVKKLDDTITFWSQGAERLYGWKKEEAIGQKAHTLLRTNTSESLENILRRVRQTGRWSGEIIHFNKNGNKIIVQSSWLATLDRHGKIMEILESNVDISGRKQAEDKIRAASFYSRSLIEASLDPLVTISADGKITDVNKATELATGYFREEMIGKDFSDYFTDSEKAKAGYRQVFTDGFVRDYPLAIRHKSGKITDVLYNAAVYRNEAGEIGGVFAAARDITELKKAEQQAQESARKLKDAERLATIGATAGMVGHDIRNPLQAILGDLYLAKDEIKSLRSGSTKNNLNESISAIEENIVYINKIISDLQDYTKPLSPSFEEFNLQRVVDDVLLQNKMPETIKASSKINAEVRTLKGDQAFMKRVIENLVLNAVQAMPSGGKLAVKARKEKGEAVITVEDTGSGIPESFKPKLFTPLFTTKSKGQGFGLAVVKRMAEAMGGTVTFESELGKGTRFIIRLPTPTDNRRANGFPNKSKT